MTWDEMKVKQEELIAANPKDCPCGFTCPSHDVEEVLAEALRVLKELPRDGQYQPVLDIINKIERGY